VCFQRIYHTKACLFDEQLERFLQPMHPHVYGDLSTHIVDCIYSIYM
jgi:hypothetical protein